MAFLPKEKVDRALKLSIMDGFFATIMGSLAGGIFLMGYALKVLKAANYQIGILASLPLFANLIQLFGAYIIEKTGKRKSLCSLGILASRILWVFVIMLPLFVFRPIIDYRVWVLVIIIAVSSFFGSLSGVAWLSWMSDLVPEETRGSYFGKRNMISGAAGMVMVLAGGKFIQYWEASRGEGDPIGYMFLFGVGLLAGLVAYIFLVKTPDVTKSVEEKAEAVNLKMFLKPLEDRNFRKLLFFVSFWIFAIQFAGPFYGVYMIENLKIDFAKIAIFNTAATLATLVMMKVMGGITDRLGNKPAIIVSGMVLVGVPYFWIFSTPENYLPLLYGAHIIGGAFLASLSLANFNVSIKLSPREGRAAYLAVFAALTGLVGASAPILSGAISNILGDGVRQLGPLALGNLHVIFLASSVMQLLSLTLILPVKEPKAAPPIAVILALRNDLNPTTGISGALDFTMMEVEKGKGILRKVDEVTDKMAAKGEEVVGRAVGRAEPFIRKILGRIYRFLKSED